MYENESWDIVKNLLPIHFGDQRNLYIDLTAMRQSYQETSLKFYIRVVSAFNLLHYVNLRGNVAVIIINSEILFKLHVLHTLLTGLNKTQNFVIHTRKIFN